MKKILFCVGLVSLIGCTSIDTLQSRIIVTFTSGSKDTLTIRYVNKLHINGENKLVDDVGNTKVIGVTAFSTIATDSAR